MFVTEAVFHEPMGWLNAEALLNMLVTHVRDRWAVELHEPMSSLKVPLSCH